MPHNILFSFAYSRLYQFIGDVTVTDSLDLQPLFAEYESNPGNHDSSATWDNLYPFLIFLFWGKKGGF